MAAYVIYIREQTYDQEELDIYVNSVGPVLEKFPMQFLAATTIIGLSYVYVRRFLSPFNLPPLVLATWQTGLALLVLLALVDRTGMANILHDWHAAAGVAIGLGVLGTGMAFLIYYYLLQELGAVAASGATYITPNVALLIGWFVGEKIGVLEIVAIILVLASIAMLQIGRQRAVREAEQLNPATIEP